MGENNAIILEQKKSKAYTHGEINTLSENKELSTLSTK